MSNVITRSRSASGVETRLSAGLGTEPLPEEKATSGVLVPSESSTISEDGSRGTPHGQDADPESLAPAPSGAAYSVFSKSTRAWVVWMISISGFVSPMTASIYFPALNPIAHDLGVSIGLINLTLTTYMIFQALAPTLFGDFGDMAGRRPAFIVGFIIYLFANIGLALQNKYAALLVLRMMQSAGSSGTVALGYAVVSDVSVSAERGRFMAYVSAGLNVGPTLGPVLGGLLAEYLGWRAIFWFCAILSVVWLAVFVLAVPETCRNVVGNGSVQPQGWNMTLLDYIQSQRHPAAERATTTRKLKFPNPLRALGVVFQKDMSMILFFNSMLYLVFMISVATLSTLFKTIYHFSDLQIGLCYLPFGAGCCLSAYVQGRLLDWNYRRIARQVGFKIDYQRGDDLASFPIEKARIQPVLPMVLAGLSANIAYGWVLHFEVHVAAALVLTFLVGLTITGSFSIVQTLIIDLYPQSPATAVASVNLVRCLLGAATMSFIENMLVDMGRGWCFTFWSLLCAAVMPTMFIIQRNGPRWREERRLRLLRGKEKDKSDKPGA